VFRFRRLSSSVRATTTTTTITTITFPPCFACFAHARTRIEGDKIGSNKLTIKQPAGFSVGNKSQTNWTRALKYMLTNLKYLLWWCSRLNSNPDVGLKPSSHRPP
jgi:hypothetical protein